MSLVRFRLWAPPAGIAHLVERHLAKVEVASSSLVARSSSMPTLKNGVGIEISKISVDFFGKTAYNNSSDGDIAKW